MIQNYFEEILSKVQRELIEAAKSDNEKVFLKLLLFLNGKILYGANGVDLSTYSTILKIPSNVYSRLPNKYKAILVKIVSFRFSENIKMLSYKDIKELEYQNASYSSLLELIKQIILFKSSSDFNVLFSEMKSSIYGSLRREDAIEKRYFYLIVFSWLSINHQEGLIEFSDFQVNLAEDLLLGNEYLYDDNYLANTFGQLLRLAQSMYWGVEHWETTEPIYDGNARMMLSARDWLYLGYALICLRKRFFQYEIEFTKINIDYFLGNEAETLEPIFIDIINNIEKYKSVVFQKDTVITQELVVMLNEIKFKAITYFENIKKEKDLKYNQELGSLKLSDDKIQKFKEQIGNRFYGSNLIYSVMNHYHKVQNVPNDFNKMGYGVYINFNRGKVAFVDGTLYQEVFGISDLASQTARDVDVGFFTTLREKAIVFEVSIETAKQSIESYLATLKSDLDYLIFCPLANYSKLFGYDSLKTLDIPNAKGELNGIPIFPTIALKNEIFIINVNDVDYKVYTNEGWFNNQLLINVENLNEEQVKSQLEKDNSSYKYVSLTKDEQEIFVRASVNIRIIFKADVIIGESAKIYRYKCTN